MSPHDLYTVQALDDCGTAWNAIKVYRDGNAIRLSGPYNSRDLAETMAEFHETKDDFEAKMLEMEKAIEAFCRLVDQYQADVRELTNG